MATWPITGTESIYSPINAGGGYLWFAIPFIQNLTLILIIEIEYFFMQGHHTHEVCPPTSYFLYSNLNFKMQFCKTWTAVQSYLQIASYTSTHGTTHFFHFPRLLLIPCRQVLVAMRVYALYGGQKFIRITLFVSGSLFLLSGLAIVTLGQLAINSPFSSLLSRKHKLTAGK